LSRAKPQRSSESRRLAVLAEEAYYEVARLAAGDPSIPPIDARFYPYANLRSTVRLREGRLYLRVSDLLESATDATLGALLRILTAKLLRKRVKAEWDEAYRKHTSLPRVIEATDEARRLRGRKEVAEPKGNVYDLDALFDTLNEVHFDGALERPRIGWTLRDGWRTHGHYDAAHKTIVLSRTLDEVRVPQFVVEFVLFHEMLHVAIPAQLRGGKRFHHTAEFRAAEARFPRFADAVAWLEKFDRPRGTRRRSKRSSRRR
jgi:hypothetical protein